MPMSVVEQYYQMIKHLDNADKIILAEKIMNSVKQESKPLNDLSKFQPRTDVVIGNSDDFVSMSWEKELNFDLPK
ncbi:MAG: hypothetical protein Q4C68_06140 [Moraxella sp.]|nr:hypothetical protein [Moraxella sp.]